MELVIDFFVFCLQAIFWWFIMSLLLRMLFTDRINAKEELAEKLANLIHKIQEEKHGDQYYWFDATNDQFLAQGSTVEEIIINLKKRFPSHVFFVTKDDQHYYIGDNTDWKFKPVLVN